MLIKYVKESKQKKKHTHNIDLTIYNLNPHVLSKLILQKRKQKKLPYYSKTEVELSHFKHSETVFLMPNRVIFTIIAIVAIQIVVILHLMANKK